MKFTEDQLKLYAAPLSETENQKCLNAIGMVRDALKNLGFTDDGKDILYERVGTVTHSDGETIIDVYNIYIKKILGKKKIATLYISGYGYENTVIAPKGFRFMTDEEFKNRH